jgi:hypothetical protein
MTSAPLRGCQVLDSLSAALDGAIQRCAPAGCFVK